MSRFEDKRTEGFGFHGSSGFYRGESSHGSGRGRGRGGRGRGRGSFGSPGRGGSKHFKPSYDQEVVENVEKLLSRKFRFGTAPESESWTLLDHTSMFRSRRSLLPELQDLKERLNGAKDQLTTTEPESWSKHTKFTNRAGSVVNGLKKEFETEMCTMNWAKMHEILWSFDIVSKSTVRYNSVHLCEAPGAFVASLNHFLKTHRTDCQWKWMATTLNPYYEGNSLTPLSDKDLFMSETPKNWFTGPNNTGDITEWENVVSLKEALKNEMKDVHLVTADGGLSSFSDPNSQEEQLCKLLYCECVCGLLLLAKEGSMIVKSFTTFEPHTVSLLYLLACTFEEISMIKPVASKSSNSEHYLVCKRYKGRPSITKRHWEQLINHYGEDVSMTTIFPLESIPNGFIDKVIRCAKELTNYQIKAIEENLDLYECMPFSKKKRILEERDLMLEKFKSNCHLKKLSRDKAVVQTVFLNGERMTAAPQIRSEEMVKEWLGRRSLDSFLSLLTQQKQGADRGDGLPEPKLPRVSLDKEAVKHVLDSLWFDGSQATDESVGVVAMEMDPSEVQWLRGTVSSTYDLSKDIKSLEGSKVDKVVNSRFCQNDIIKSLSATLAQSQIMDSSHVDEHTHVASHMTPGHALQGQDPPYFLNRDAVNFAALDFLTGFIRKGNDVLLFMDLAGAPSGFSHYVYWRRQNTAKGWGLVRSERPILGPGSVLERLAPWETFQVLGPHNGVNICDSNTIRSLCAGVENYCPDGVQLVIGDVPEVPFGAHPPGQAEILVQQHFLSQLICALKILGKGGTFVCRCYELLTRFSAGVLFIAYKLFREVTILKPMTSLPSSSERFLLCRGFHGNKQEITDSLLEINGVMTEVKDQSSEKNSAVLEIVPMERLLEEAFHRYLTQSNERIVKHRLKVISSLEKAFQSPKQLPDSESQQLLCRGTMEILDLPLSPSYTN